MIFHGLQASVVGLELVIMSVDSFHFLNLGNFKLLVPVNTASKGDRSQKHKVKQLIFSAY